MGYLETRVAIAKDAGLQDLPEGPIEIISPGKKFLSEEVRSTVLRGYFPSAKEIAICRIVPQARASLFSTPERLEANAFRDLPGFVTYFDPIVSVSNQGIPYVVFFTREIPEGISLAESTFTGESLIDVFLQTAKYLRRAKDLQKVHGDITPQNIIVQAYSSNFPNNLVTRQQVRLEKNLRFIARNPHFIDTELSQRYGEYLQGGSKGYVPPRCFDSEGLFIPGSILASADSDAYALNRTIKRTLVNSGLAHHETYHKIILALDNEAKKFE